MEASQQYQESQQYKLFAEAIHKEASTWLNVKYRHLGRTRRGVDCQGLVLCIYSALGFEIPIEKKDESYSFNWHLGQPEKLEKRMLTYCKFIKYKEHLVGDVCAFKVNHTRANHMGLWLDKNIFIHSSLVVGKSVQKSDYRHNFWSKNYVGTFRPYFIMEQLKQWADKSQQDK
jgi:cell wall-associated NlpC family hydrolase